MLRPRLNEPAPRLRPARRSAFTLVEVLIVVVILAILAATVLPQFTNASSDAVESSIKQNLSVVRSQIELYRVQHNGQLPTTAFETQMLNATNKSGATTGAGLDYGPYVSRRFPLNTGCDQFQVQVVETAPDYDDATPTTHGWMYSTVTGEFRAIDSAEHFGL